MPKRLAFLVALFTLAIHMTLLPVASASADVPSPWWQVLTGSRPTNLWEPRSQVQEIQAPKTLFGLLVEGSFVGAFNSPPFFPEATAENVQAALEGAYGAGDVEVTGGPGGTAPLIVTSIGDDAGKYVPPLEGFNATTKILQVGGSGRLVLTITNLGDAPMDASSTPLTIVDELPEGVEASGVEARAGAVNKFGPVNCGVETSTRVACTFEGILPSFEAIEIEIFASLTGAPPIAGAPGRVTVSGGNAPPADALQQIRVSPDKTPFGIESFFARSEDEDGLPVVQAGSHPFQLTTNIQLNSGPMTPASSLRPVTVEQPALPRNFRFALPAGLVGNAAALPRCPEAAFHDGVLRNSCPDDSAIGVASATVIETSVLGLTRLAVPIFNLPPAEGEPARFGFTVAGSSVVIDTAVDPDNQYRILASVNNASQVAELLSTSVTLWGAPGDPRHDNARGWACVYHAEDVGRPCVRPTNLGEEAFLREPVSCATPRDFLVELEPWNVELGSVVEKAQSTQPNLLGCNRVPFNPTLGVSPTDRSAGGSSGLDFRLDMPNAGLLNKDAIAEGQAKKVEVTLPEGMTINPAQANGLGACTPADYARERFDSAPGEGCPESSKIGTVDISTPLLEEEAHGSVYVAAPYENPFGSLLALYVVAKTPERGILIKQPGKVSLNPATGQIITTFDDLPQIPFDAFELSFFAGDRAPLVMPPRCGTYETVARLTPWHAADPDNPLPNEIVERRSSFTVDRGIGGPCPSGTPPFKPNFSAGTTNNAAGSYSPFIARLTRTDGEQEFSRFSLKLPPGVIGKLAGIPFCPEAAIAAARARTGPSGGQEELDGPSCSPASQIGRTQVGAGVGQSLAYAPGKIYLAGPYQGAKLSIVAITTAKIGPFDLGNVVIRQALRIDPETAEVTADGSNSDPIPHILAGIVVHARDIRVYVDRENFLLNPTSCERMTVSANVLGSGTDLANAVDDQLATPSVPFQAANCASLRFRPKLSLSLRGGTERGDTPRLRAVLKARKGEANIGRAQVTLPRSAFLEQAHIRTVCTRVQFNAGAGNGERCPKGSVYGKAVAVSPLLDEPLRGKVYLRSSDHPLPDLVAALGSRKVDINLAGRIDSLNGRLRTTFAAVPDAPITKFVLQMQGGRKGLIVNSTDICDGKHRAVASFTGQNEKRRKLNPLVKARCGGKKARKGGRG